MKKEIIKARGIPSCFLRRLDGWGVIRDRFNVRSDWEDSSNTTIGGLPEFRATESRGFPVIGIDRSNIRDRSTIDVGRSR